MINGNPIAETLNNIADGLNVPETELFKQLHLDPTSLSCPHYGKNINIKVE